MGKTGKWFKSFLSGKKEKGSKHEKKSLVDESSHSSYNNSKENGSMTGGGGGGKDNVIPPPPPVVGVVPLPRPTTPKDKKRWSFRRSSATSPNSKDVSCATIVSSNGNSTVALAESEPETKPEELDENIEKPSLVVEVADNNDDNDTTEMDARRECVIEEAAAVRIQCVFRSYLARKALKALRGLVKLQALVRGHLVRKQATATLRCMQALVTAQARARAQRIRTVDDGRPVINHRQSTHRRNSHEKIKQSYHDMEENIKIVEMDQGEYGSTHSYSIPNQQQHNFDRLDGKISTYYQQISPAPSAINDMSPRTCSGHFEDYAYATAQSSPQCYSTASRPDQSQPTFSFPNPEFADTMSYEYPLYPSYMANTESSRAKARSQSAPKQRPEFERQMSRGRRPSVEGRSSIPKGARMQRSSSHVGAAEKNYQYPWSVSVKLDKSAVSLKDSECGSSCSVFTNANNYSRSVVSYDPRY